MKQLGKRGYTWFCVGIMTLCASGCCDTPQDGIDEVVKQPRLSASQDSDNFVPRKKDDPSVGKKTIKQSVYKAADILELTCDKSTFTVRMDQVIGFTRDSWGYCSVITKKGTYSYDTDQQSWAENEWRIWLSQQKEKCQ